jgi:hypothetical protein
LSTYFGFSLFSSFTFLARVFALWFCCESHTLSCHVREARSGTAWRWFVWYGMV